MEVAAGGGGGGGMKNELTSACTCLKKKKFPHDPFFLPMLPLSFQSGQQLRLR